MRSTRELTRTNIETQVVPALMRLGVTHGPRSDPAPKRALAVEPLSEQPRED